MSKKLQNMLQAIDFLPHIAQDQTTLARLSFNYELDSF